MVGTMSSPLTRISGVHRGRRTRQRLARYSGPRRRSHSGCSAGCSHAGSAGHGSRAAGELRSAACHLHTAVPRHDVVASDGSGGIALTPNQHGNFVRMQLHARLCESHMAVSRLGDFDAALGGVNRLQYLGAGVHDQRLARRRTACSGACHH